MRQRRQNHEVAGELNLTAMIDVAIQLLAFFLIAAHPVDIVGQIGALRPTEGPPWPDPGPEIRITVFPDGYQLNEQLISPARLERILAKLGSLDPNQTVVIRCLNQAPHAGLVTVLDLCAKHQLKNLAVVSSGGA